MIEFREDPINEAIYGKHGIMSAIDVLFEKECVTWGLMIIMCGIDLMSNLDRPEGNSENTPEDFKNWVKKYIRLRDDNILTPDDLWGARNAMLHTYGVFSKDVRSGKAKIITWVPNRLVPMRYDPEADQNLVMVDPSAFREAFSKGVSDFRSSTLSDTKKKPIIEQRLPELITYSMYIKCADGKVQARDPRSLTE